MSATPSVERDPASFRDPAGCVVHVGDRVLRVVDAAHASLYAAVWATGVPQQMCERGLVVKTSPLDGGEAAELLGGSVPDGAQVLEHERLRPITYPYEWTFEALRDAAILHLDLHLALLQQGLTLSDASAFNVQLAGTSCLHIDALSIVPYEEGTLWSGYDQFLREFLNPLVIEAATGFAANNHYRGTLSGLSTRDAERLLPLRWKLKPGIAAHIVLPAKVEKGQSANPRALRRAADTAPATKRSLPRARFVAMLEQLRRIVSGLPAPPGRNAAWSGYARANSYAEAEAASKRAVVAAWAGKVEPAAVLDLGCNTGAMAEVALDHGARRVIGIDSDRACLDLCWIRAKAARRPILPLHIDLANPSPAQGWCGRERSAMSTRLKGDGLLALALIHHLAIGRNLPLDQVVQSIVDLAPTGLIEFVPKGDPMIDVLLSFRRDIFPDYTLAAFRAALSRRADIVAETQVTANGRCIVEYRRH